MPGFFSLGSPDDSFGVDETGVPAVVVAGVGFASRAFVVFAVRPDLLFREALEAVSGIVAAACAATRSADRFASKRSARFAFDRSRPPSTTA